VITFIFNLKIGGKLLTFIKTTNASTMLINLKRKSYCYIFTFLELLAIKINFFYQLVMKCRKPTILKEIKRTKITSKDRVLVIGCGIFPSTSIIIANESNAQVTGIDNNMNAIHLARSYLCKKRLNKNIFIEYGAGSTYQSQPFDIIIVAINAYPIDFILNHLAQTMKSGARLICRGLNNDIPNIISKDEMSQSFVFSSCSEDPMFFFSTYPATQSFLFIKK